MEPTEKDLEAKKATEEAAKQALRQKVREVLIKETLDTGLRLWNERRFGASTLDTPYFDFIRVSEPDEQRNERFLMMLYAYNHTNSYHPRSLSFQGWDIYPIGFKVEQVLRTFREDLEKGTIPRHALHQTSVKTIGEENTYNAYFPCCIEVKDKEDIEALVDLVSVAVNLGIRDEIIVKSPEDMPKILSRVENDDSLDFNYIDN